MKTKVYTKVMVHGEDPSWHHYYRLRKWCTANFGPSKIKDQKDYQSPWRAERRSIEFSLHYMELPRSSAFYFRDPSHATMFRLVWADKIR